MKEVKEGFSYPWLLWDTKKLLFHVTQLLNTVTSCIYYNKFCAK